MNWHPASETLPTPDREDMHLRMTGPLPVLLDGVTFGVAHLVFNARRDGSPPHHWVVDWPYSAGAAVTHWAEITPPEDAHAPKRP